MTIVSRAGVLPRLGLAVLVAGALSLIGCTSSSSDSSSGSGSKTKDTGGDEVMVLAVSGAHVSLQGTWSFCIFDEDQGFDQTDVNIFDGLNFTSQHDTYQDSVDGTCSGDVTVDPAPATGTFASSAGTDKVLTGWTDGTDGIGLVDAPIALDGETVISNPPLVTVSAITIEGVDDSSPNLVTTQGTPGFRFVATADPPRNVHKSTVWISA